MDLREVWERRGVGGPPPPPQAATAVAEPEPAEPRVPAYGPPTAEEAEEQSFAAKYARVHAKRRGEIENLRAQPLGLGAELGQIAKTVPRTVVGMAASVPEFAAITGTALRKLADSGYEESAEDHPLFDMGQAMRDWTQEHFPRDQRAGLATTVAEGVVSSLAVMGGGGALTALKVPRYAGMAGLSAMVGGVPDYHSIRMAGGTEEQAIAGMGISSVFSGITEPLPLEEMLDPQIAKPFIRMLARWNVDGKITSGLGRALLPAAKGSITGAAEGLQELADELKSDFVRGAFSPEDISLSIDWGGSGKAGFLSGFLLDVAFGALGMGGPSFRQRVLDAGRQMDIDQAQMPGIAGTLPQDAQEAPGATLAPEAPGAAPGGEAVPGLTDADLAQARGLDELTARMEASREPTEAAPAPVPGAEAAPQVPNIVSGVSTAEEAGAQVEGGMEGGAAQGPLPAAAPPPAGEGTPLAGAPQEQPTPEVGPEVEAPRPKGVRGRRIGSFGEIQDKTFLEDLRLQARPAEKDKSGKVTKTYKVEIAETPDTAFDRELERASTERGYDVLWVKGANIGGAMSPNRNVLVLPADGTPGDRTYAVWIHEMTHGLDLRSPEAYEDLRARYQAADPEGFARIQAEQELQPFYRLQVIRSAVDRLAGKEGSAKSREEYARMAEQYEKADPVAWKRAIQAAREKVFADENMAVAYEGLSPMIMATFRNARTVAAIANNDRSLFMQILDAAVKAFNALGGKAQLPSQRRLERLAREIDPNLPLPTRQAAQLALAWKNAVNGLLAITEEDVAVEAAPEAAAPAVAAVAYAPARGPPERRLEARERRQAERAKTAETVVFEPEAAAGEEQARGFVQERRTGERRDVQREMRKASKGETRFAASRNAPPYFSALERAVDGLKQERFTAQQLTAVTKKAPGVTDEEMAWVGWEDMLHGRKSITKAEALEWLRAHRVEVTEKVVGQPIQAQYDVVAQRMYGQPFASLPGPTRRVVAQQAEAESNEQAPSFAEYTLPGGENYRELLLTLPGLDWKGGHFSTPGVLAHLRVTDRTAVAPASVQPQADKPGADSLAASAKLLADIAERPAFASHGFGALNVKDKEAVLSGVLSAVGDPEVLRGVVELVPVDVVNQLAGKKLSPKEFLSDRAMLSDSLSGDPNAAVRLSPGAARRLVGAVARLATERVASPEYLPGPPPHPGTAPSAGDVHRPQRTLFIEEIQSDLHQRGRKAGYKGKAPSLQWHQSGRRWIGTHDEPGAWRVDPDGLGGFTVRGRYADEYRHFDTAEEAKAHAENAARQFREGLGAERGGVPDAPWKKDWHALALKRAIKLAADEGYDQIAWTTGAQQRDRYGSGNIAEGGMEGFYDKMLVDAANKLGKRFGVTVGGASLDVTDADAFKVEFAPGPLEAHYRVRRGGVVVGAFETADAAWNFVGDQFQSDAVHALPIPPEMRAVVQSEGFSTFATRFALSDALSKGSNDGIGAGALSDARAWDAPPDAWYRRWLQKFGKTAQRFDVHVNAIERAGGVIAEDLDPRIAIAQLPRLQAKELDKMEREYQQPILKALGENGISLEDGWLYTYARSAPRANAVLKARFDKDNGSGMSDADAAAIVAKAHGENQAAYEKLWELTKAMNTAALDTRVKYGLLSPEQAAMYRADYGDEYMPYRTHVEGSADIKRGRGFSVRGPEFKKRKGRMSMADNGLVFAMLQFENAIIRGEQNAADQKIGAFFMTHPDPTLWTVEKPKAARAEMDEAGQVVDPKERLKEELKDNEFAYKVNGQQWVWKIKDDALSRGLKGMGGSTSNVVLRLLSSVNRYQSIVNTMGDPTFLPRNLIRDIQTAGVFITAEQSAGMAKKVLKNVAPAVKGMFAYNRDPNAKGYWAERAALFVENGGRMGWFASPDFETKTKKLDRKIKDYDPSKPRQAFLALAGVWEFVTDANSAAENGVRLAYFDALVNAGGTPRKAGHLAATLTVDFNQKGELGSTMTALYLFFNANMQGQLRMVGSLAKHPRTRKIAAGIFVAGFVNEIVNYLLADDDDDGENVWEKTPEWMKSRYMMLTIGKKRYHFPLLFGFGAFFRAGQHAAAFTRNVSGMGKGETALQAGVRTLADGLTSFNPFGAGPWAQMVSPTFSDPFVQHATNKTWRDTPLTKPQMYEKLPASENNWGSENPTLVDFAQWVNRITGGDAKTAGWGDFSPAVVENYMGWVIGGAGRFTTKVETLAEKGARGERILHSDIPFWRDFVSSPEPGYIKQKFYENIEEIESMKSRQEARKERGQARLETPFSTAWAAKARRVRARAKAMRDKAQTADTPAEKERLEDEALQFMKEFNRSVLEAQGGKR